MIIQKHLHFTIFKKKRQHVVTKDTMLSIYKKKNGSCTGEYYLIESHVESHTSRYHSNRQQPQLTNHVLSDVSHSVEFFLTDFT